MRMKSFYSGGFRSFLHTLQLLDVFIHFFHNRIRDNKVIIKLKYIYDFKIVYFLI